MKLLADAHSISLSLILLVILAGLQACGGGGGDGGGGAVNTSPAFTSGTSISVAENTTITGYTAVATDADGDTVTFSLTGGADQAVFGIDSSSGVLSFNVAADFDVPVDSDSNNTYVVEITATDGTNSVAQNVTVTVTDVLWAQDIVVSTVGVKTIQFDWPVFTGASHYKLFVSPIVGSGFSLLQDNLLGTSTTIELPVHLTDWINASYLLEAHDGAGKLEESSLISITALMIPSIGYVKASNTDAGDFFGFVVSLSADGNTMAVGASGEASRATGIGGDQADDLENLGEVGAVYVFSRNGSIWAQQAYVKASNAELDDRFGSAVSLSGDGNTLAVGAIGEDSGAIGIGGNQTDNSTAESGAVYVYSRSGATWSQQSYVKASNAEANDLFGITVSLSADGNTLAVGAVDEDSNATGIGGNQAGNTAAESGAVYVYSRSGTIWSQQAYVKASNTEADDGFGITISLSGDGNTLAVGAAAEDSSASDGEADNTAENSGAVYVFSFDGTSWSQQAYVKASNAEASDEFGTIVSLSGDGNTLAVGARLEDSSATVIGGDQGNDVSTINSGAVYVFSFDGASWSQQAYVKASNTEQEDLFGVAVSLSDDGNTLAVGARLEDSNATGISGDQTDNSAAFSGAVYVFSFDGASWSQRAYVKASNTGVADLFGRFVSLSADGKSMAVGAIGESSNATGIGGNQTGNLETSSGAVYLY